MGHTDGKIQNIGEMKEDELAALRNQKIGFVFQQFNLLPAYDRTEECGIAADVCRGEWLDQKNHTHQRSDAILDAVGLSDRKNHRPTELSGGQQQRVAIARALINEPDLVLADEPTGNLDSHTGEEIINLLLSLNKERGLTLVIVTHDSMIASRTQRVIRLRDGLIESEVRNETLPTPH